jgi:hypothetical protein
LQVLHVCTQILVCLGWHPSSVSPEELSEDADGLLSRDREMESF